MTFKHLTLQDRITIHTRLDSGVSFKAIAREIGKHQSSISNEIRKYRKFVKSGSTGQRFNDCARIKDCRVRFLCHDCLTLKRYCHVCGKCIEHCSMYEKHECQRLTHPPYVCSGCMKRNTCRLEKAIYDPVYANEQALTVLHNSRNGISMDPNEVERLDAIITPAIRQGQSLYHFFETYRDTENITMPSLRTLYTYVDNRILGIRSLDLPRKVKYKPRRKPHENPKTDRKCREGRKYEDYCRYIKDNPDTPITQMDSVIDTTGRCSLLTIHLVTSHFMLAYIRQGNTAESVADIFDKLEHTIGLTAFRNLFPILLTDNGSEFSDPETLEKTQTGQQRTRIFYCAPHASWQKGAIENNHELIRRVLPKGTSFENITQTQIQRMMNNINSYSRKKLNGRTPYDTFSFMHGTEILEALGAVRIDADDVILLPSLLLNRH